MSKQGYVPVFAERAAEFLLQLPKRRQKQVVGFAKQLAIDPHVRSDYFLPDESGRAIEHLMIEDYVFAYWVDHAVREVELWTSTTPREPRKPQKDRSQDRVRDTGPPTRK